MWLVSTLHKSYDHGLEGKADLMPPKWKQTHEALPFRGLEDIAVGNLQRTNRCYRDREGDSEKQCHLRCVNLQLRFVCFQLNGN